MTSRAHSKITVAGIVQSRYGDQPAGVSRPDSWDQRKDGIDVITATSGETYRLWSDGQQSVPQKGWVILLTAGDSGAGYRWTLFGMPS